MSVENNVADLQYKSGDIINNKAIQMDIKPKSKQQGNIEDTYETLSKLDLGI